MEPPGFRGRDGCRADAVHHLQVAVDIGSFRRAGKNNYDVDRAAAAEWIGIDPGIEAYAKASRPFIQRVVRYLVGEGVRQFLDIGTGLPTDQNTHVVAQAVAPESRIAYVDNDPLVLTHARALLTNTTDEGVVSYIDADARRPDEVISQARHILNLREPVAVMMFNILGHIETLDEACSIVRTLMDAVTPGSFFAHSDGINTPTALIAQEKYKDTGAVPYHCRPLEALEQIYAAPGLEMIEPGLVPISQWRPNIGRPAAVPAYGGVARKTAQLHPKKVSMPASAVTRAGCESGAVGRPRPATRSWWTMASGLVGLDSPRRTDPFGLRIHQSLHKRETRVFRK